MTEALIKFEKVNMTYRTAAYRGLSLKEHVFNIVTRKQPYKHLIKDVHALKDISFTIHAGERVALVGANGAGKSTLLRTIAQIYPITSGEITTVGNIRSLFELNIGFEAEASGRENIMYRGLLLGQTPKQMRALTEDIIEFAEIGEFIDYPVKTYSAGMQVRLAFAISTMIQGDILLLDEVIAAGDAGFIKKAKARIKNLIKQAKILVLATHDLAAAEEFCTRAFLMSHGELIFDGNIADAIEVYQNKVVTTA